MNPTMAFLFDVALTALLSVCLVAYVKTHLRALLVEICGTPERASFWLAFSNVTLVLVPLIFALDYQPVLGPDKTLTFEMATQVKYALIGFIIALSSLAIILLQFIPRSKPGAIAGPVS